MYSQCRHIKGCSQNVSEHIYGTDGYSQVGGPHTIFPKSGDPWRYPGKKVGGHQQEQLNMIDALARGEVYNEGDYGAKSTMTNILGRCATYSGKEVTFDQALNSKVELCPNIDSLTWESEAPVQMNSAGGYDAPVPGKTRVI